jgi:hypothetical protein
MDYSTLSKLYTQMSNHLHVKSSPPPENVEKSYHELLDPLTKYLGASDNSHLGLLKALRQVSMHSRKASSVALRDRADRKIAEIYNIGKVTRAVFDPRAKSLVLENNPGKDRLYKAITSWFRDLLESTLVASKRIIREESNRGRNVTESKTSKYGIPMVDSLILFQMDYEKNSYNALHGSVSDAATRPAAIIESRYRKLLDTLVEYLESHKDATWGALAKKFDHDNESSSPSVFPSNLVVSGLNDVLQIVKSILAFDAAILSRFATSINLGLRDREVETMLTDIREAYQPRALLKAARRMQLNPSWYGRGDMTNVMQLRNIVFHSNVVLTRMKVLFTIYQDLNTNNNKLSVKQATRIRDLF